MSTENEPFDLDASLESIYDGMSDDETSETPTKSANPHPATATKPAALPARRRPMMAMMMASMLILSKHQPTTPTRLLKPNSRKSPPSSRRHPGGPMRDHFATLPADVQDEILRREGDFHNGIQQYKARRRLRTQHQERNCAVSVRFCSTWRQRNAGNSVTLAIRADAARWHARAEARCAAIHCP